MILWSWQVYNLFFVRSSFSYLIIAQAIVLSAVCVAVRVITMEPSICRPVMDAAWDQVPWHPAGSYLEAFPQAALTVLCSCCAVLWSPETRARLLSQDYVSPSLTSWKTRQNTVLRNLVVRTIQQPLRENFHSSQLPKELCANRRGNARLQQATSNILVKEMLIVCTATSRVSNQIWFKWSLGFHSQTKRKNQI